MHSTILAAFFEISRTVVSMCSAGILLFLIALWAAKTDIAQARGLDKIVALSNLCFAIPLAVFGALHLSGARVRPAPGALVYAVAIVLGVFRRLCAAGRVFEHCHENSGALVRPAVRDHDVSFCGDVGSSREFSPPQRQVCMDAISSAKCSFGGGGWILAGNALREQGRGQSGSKLITVGRVLIGIAAIFFGVEHFLHPVNVPGVPLEKLMPAWIPGRLLIGYLTGAILLVAGASILLAKKTRMAATYLGTWIVLLVVFIYGPILIASLADPSTDVKVEGINYFADTLLFAGAILALASATPRTD